MTSPSPSSAPGGYARIRFASGTDLRAIPDLPYMVQLMACLEAMRSALRWGIHLESAHELAPPHEPDRITVWFVCAGWCAEAFRLLQQAETEGTIFRTMLEGKTEQEALWDRIIAKNRNGIIGKIHRIRDKYFGHFDREVISNFVTYQDTHGAQEPFLIGTENG